MKTLKTLPTLSMTAIIAVMLLSACSKTDFAPVSDTTQTKNDIPVDPEVPPPTVGYGFKLSNGQCNSDSSTQLLSCSKCEVPQIKLEPQLSKKAQALLDVMLLSCSVSNKSDLNAVRPTREMLLNKLNQASQINYPETTRTADMELLIKGLTNTADSSLRNKMFGGLWYQPPYSNTFEQYFGLSVVEAKSTFCWNGDKMDGAVTSKTGVYSIEWLNCQYSSPNPYA